MNKQVILTSAVVYASGLDANGAPITEELRVPVATSVDDVARFGGAGSEAHRMAQTILNPSTETWDQNKRVGNERHSQRPRRSPPRITRAGYLSGFSKDGFFNSIDELREHCKKFDVPVPGSFGHARPNRWTRRRWDPRPSIGRTFRRRTREHLRRGNSAPGVPRRMGSRAKIVSWHEDDSRAVIL